MSGRQGKTYAPICDARVLVTAVFGLSLQCSDVPSHALELEKGKSNQLLQVRTKALALPKPCAKKTSEFLSPCFLHVRTFSLMPVYILLRVYIHIHI